MTDVVRLRTIAELIGRKTSSPLSPSFAPTVREAADEIERLNTAIMVRNADVQSMFERAQAVEAFVEDMHAVGRLRLTPEWQERMERVMRFRNRESQDARPLPQGTEQ